MKKKKNNGFTLVELMTVIIIIAIIAVIIMENVTSKIESSKENAYDIQINNIESAAKKYVIDNSIDDKYHLNTTCITIKMLQDKGYLKKGNIKNPKTDKNFDLNKNYIKIKYDFQQNQYQYIFTDSCISNDIIPISETIISNNDIKITGNEDGLYETSDSYVFRGLNPNNYIKINNNVWRIVSIDKETMMLKVINLNGYQKQVTSSTFIKDLNDEFETGTTYSMIKDYINLNSKWNSGIVSNIESANTLKTIEKQSNNFNTISLLTVGEYIDASLDKKCYIKNNCNSYLSRNSNYWLLNTTKDNKNWFISEDNKLNYASQTTQLYNIYPCMYLKLNNIMDSEKKGVGTELDPYVLKLSDM